MHSYLRAVGFSNIKNRKEMETLINTVINNAAIIKRFHTEDAVVFAELSMEVADNIGIMIYGEYDSEDNFHLDHYFPYFKGKNISTREEVYISKRVDTDSFTGMCDDYRLGVSLIFYLQNALDFIERRKSIRPSFVFPVYLSALSLEGKIILPVEKTESQVRISNADVNNRNLLIAEAKKGNQEAIDSLTIDDIDLFSMITKRIQKEDIYSIVETSFIPYGSESDNYTVLGTILECSQYINTETKEELYTLLVECNQLCFEICINKNDLFGEPMPGRRFKGNVWMQGSVEF